MLGELHHLDGRHQLRFVRHLPCPPEKVWRAITEPEHLRAWFPADIEGERTEGAELRFVFRNNEGPDLPGAMLVYQPPSALEFTWDADTFRIDLEPDGTGTRMTLVQTFAEYGKAARDASGWHACLDVLGHHLDGTQPPWEGMERWEQVHEEYVAALGPDSATIGPPESKRR